MSTYPQRVADNILPLSVAGNLPEAFDEWYFTENIEDHEVAESDCELCDQEQLRYHFEIQNRHTDKALWVGSSCILKFQVAVYDGQTRLEPRMAKQKLDKLTQRMRQESCIKALEKLASDESNDILANALTFYRQNKHLTPKYAFVVFWRLNANNIDHHPSFFKISLRRDKHKNDLSRMPLKRVHIIWPALTSSQRKIAVELGHTPPTET